MFLVEGPGVVLEALGAGAEIHDVFLHEDVDDLRLIEALAQRDIAPWRVARDVIESLSETVTPQGVIAVVSAAARSLDVLRSASLVLVLAEVRDPGNAGTLIRSATAAGADAVVFAQGSVDPLHPKVVRAAAGALFRVPLVRSVPLAEAADVLRDANIQIVGAAAEASADMYEADLTTPCAFVLGNEAWGLSPDAEGVVDRLVRIPMPGPTESLNVSTAGSILLFEALRQRRASGGS